MTIPVHLSRFTSNPSHLTAASSVSTPEQNRKKEFPSVAKLLDGLRFHDDSHPDFLIRSARFKSRSIPLAHRSPLIEYSALCVHSNCKSQLSSSATRVNRLDSSIESNHLSTHSSRPDPTLPMPILIQTSSESNPETPFPVPSPIGSELSSVSSSVPLTESRKRPYVSEDDDDERDLSASVETPNSAPGLRINWHSKLNQPNTDYDRVMARPSRTWLKRTVEEPARACFDEGNETGDQLLGLIFPRSFEIHQADKRRRFIHSPRFHQVVR